MFRKNGKPNFWKILPLSQNGSFFPQFASESLYTSFQNSLFISFSEISPSNGTLQIKKNDSSKCFEVLQIEVFLP